MAYPPGIDVHDTEAAEVLYEVLDRTTVGGVASLLAYCRMVRLGRHGELPADFRLFSDE